MNTILMASSCQTTGADLFDKGKRGCSLPVQEEKSCGCKSQKSSCGCGCGGHSKNGTMEYKGTVIDKEMQEALPLATLKNLNTNQGEVTNDLGNFTIQAHPDDIIEVGFVGMKPQSFLASKLPATIELKSDGMLDEVVLDFKKGVDSIKNNAGIWVGIGLVGLFAYAKTRKPKRSTTPKKPAVNG